MRTRIVSGLVGALLAAGVSASVMAAPALAETGQESRHHWAKTTVTVDSGAAVALDFFGIKLTALWPATGSTPTFTFPVCAKRGGVVELLGGLRFTANDKAFTVYAPVVNTDIGVVKAGRLELFSIDGQNLVLTAAGAQALNESLGFSGLFSQGFLFGSFVTSH
ncbi:hypothetical protein KIPE111705_35715 [Kibdelosporangium persicum]|uniref:Htaa protein n=1 Tax=Kibdelosporangium persicum TaxID=2698649 RepID=A0ABX2F977_9PSEU|nr:hypothetical protein [Kibdelosporangium persicum]NRN67872.1 hypothetical protein [Kibdelosporangium persicum]